MPVAAVVAGSVIAGAVSAKGAKDAAKTQAGAAQQASDQAVAEQRRQYDLTRQDQAPWMEAGRNALATLQNPLANFQASPDFAFRQQQGMQGIERSAAARGGAFSGNALKALNEYNSNLASGEFGNWWGRQSQLAGFGQDATNAVGQFGARTSDNISDSYQRAGQTIGDANAMGKIGASNALAGSVTGISNGIGTWLAMRQKPQQLDYFQPNTPFAQMRR